MRRHSKLVFWSSLALLLAACSTAEIFYDNADRLLLKQMDEYLALSNAQEVQVIALLRTRLTFNKEHELPRYHAFLSQVRDSLADGLTPVELDALLAHSEVLFTDTARSFLPLLAKTLALLDSEQITYLAERLADDMQDSRQRLAERDADWQEERISRMMDNAEDWLAELDDAQQAILRAYVLALPDTYAASLRYREKRQQGLLALLQAGSDAAAIEHYLAANWLRQEQLDPELSAQWDAQSAMFRELVLQLDATFSPAQRQHALDKIDEYRKLLVDMHDAPIGAPIGDGNRHAPAFMPSGAAAASHTRQD